MAGTSDSKQPDDLKLHLEQIRDADDARAIVPEGETDAQRKARESLRLRPKLRARVGAVLRDLQGAVPGLSAAETKKLLATRDARDALKKGTVALARVDDFLQGATGERNPLIGKDYGVYGDNPTSFGGVLRALELSVGENGRRAALPDTAENADERELLFTELIQAEVEAARDTLAALVAARLGTRADLSRAVSLKDKTLDEARAVISAVRSHLYANMPDRKQDVGLRDYGFRPLRAAGGRPKVVAKDPAVTT
jgi:hypothetical protein